jgi:hypothetical protein
MAVHPTNGKIYVSNTEARNLVRFENNLNGNMVRQRVTIIDPAGPTVTPVHVNPHIDYSVTPGPQSEIDMSLSILMDMKWNQTGTLLYLTAMGTGKVAILNAAGAVVARWNVGEGPTGLALDEGRNRVYVLDRFAQRIVIVSIFTGSTLGYASLGYNPEPPIVRNGRKFLYDARITSGHGDASCASCHAFANFDHQAWDLGVPTGVFLPPPPGQADTMLTGFHPMKGPFMTQSLRGMLFSEPLHTRGDRADFFEFNIAFTGLMGRASQLTGADMAAFNDFIMTVAYPPNPNQNLDRSFPNPPLLPSAERGRQAFTTLHLDDGLLCVECHSFPFGTNNQIISATVMGNSQDLDVSQLRNMYEKTGFTKTGATKSGFGFTHNGSFETMFQFLQLPFFTFSSNTQRRDMEAFMLAFDTDMAPAVGAQQTIDGTNKNTPSVVSRIATLLSQANIGNIDLQVKGRVGGLARGYRYAGSGMFEPDRTSEPMVFADTLRNWASAGGELTYTGLPPGCGMRAIDRDGDSYRDRDELDAGSDPANPNSTPLTGGVVTGGPGDERLLGGLVKMLLGYPNPTRGQPSRISFELRRPAHVTLRIFDAKGRLIRTLIEGSRNGIVETTWDLRDEQGRSMPSGVYFYRLEGEEFLETRRLTILP